MAKKASAARRSEVPRWIADLSTQKKRDEALALHKEAVKAISEIYAKQGSRKATKKQ
jgi:hypothetical protein